MSDQPERRGAEPRRAPSAPTSAPSETSAQAPARRAPGADASNALVTVPTMTLEPATPQASEMP